MALPRRRVLLTVAGAVSLGGCLTLRDQSDNPTAEASVIGTPPAGQPLTEKYGGHEVVYDHEQVRLTARRESVALDETIRFDVTNVSEASASLGCHNPWTLQRFVESDDPDIGGWYDCFWTTSEGFDTCATVLDADETASVEATMATPVDGPPAESMRGDLSPGRYRFVVLGTDPFAAVDFRITTK